MRKTNQSKGFTLVEMSIVLVIIGLIIGGVLKGQGLIDNAKTKRLITDMKAINASFYAFQDKYLALPGDIQKANSVIARCITAATTVNGITVPNSFCKNGDGDSFIGGAGKIAWNSSAIKPATDRKPEETSQAWKHMALSGFIGGVDISKDVSQINNLGWGITHPTSPLGGGFELYYDGQTTAGISGHFLRLSNTGLTNASIPVNGSNGTGALSSEQAYIIDAKIDDGLARSGTILSNYGNTGGSEKCVNTADDTYLTITSGKQCTTFFLLDK